MDLSSLPSRPLAGSEVAALGESDAFVAVRPVDRFEFEAVEETLVVGVVLVTERGARAAHFSPADGWRVVYREDVEGVEGLADVSEATIGEAQRELRSLTDELESERGFGSRLVDAYESEQN
ncbi:hypothetical protein [Halocalculus aciditolerans]|uniref:DUF7964 domain-containing protein n=1 Tax=Halocalculus aciditolerans TaxID=1383812 RepID=A0A830FK75_9EURY|nr:hypothetical protein [Halocalculus aciditolerans]GGL64033.1 hypothetical protein GCM10009039_22350 [Halocalculus aciditolerans]